jgi:SAM-dependent methyltransferase
MEKKYWSDWFSNNIPAWEEVFQKYGLKGTHFLNFLEIGCFEGRATNYLLENVLTGNDCKIHVVDTFGGSLDEAGMKWDVNYDFSKLYDTFVNNIGENMDRVVVHRGESGKILKSDFKENYFDFIYIDGSHTAPDVLQDAVLCHPLLKTGGIMIFDDYGWKDPNVPDPTNSPAMAVDFFYAVNRNKYDVVMQGYQVGLLKKSN